LEFMDVVRKRRSIRKYRPDPVPQAEIDYVLEAARLAPSWGNKQCWRYIVVTDEALRKRISLRESTAAAPAIVVACADPALSGNRDGKPYFMLDVGIGMEHLVLAAAERGLGTCWLGGQFDEKVVKEALGVPENVRVVAMTPLGYPDEDPAPRDRKPAGELVGRNHW
jgi:nitroreductase